MKQEAQMWKIIGKFVTDNPPTKNTHKEHYNPSMKTLLKNVRIANLMVEQSKSFHLKPEKYCNLINE
jgi:hypothetical protein